MVDIRSLTKTQQKMRCLCYILLWGTAIPIILGIQFWHYNVNTKLSEIIFPIVSMGGLALTYLIGSVINKKFNDMAKRNKDKELYQINLENFDFEECHKYCEKNKKPGDHIDIILYDYIETHTDFNKNIHIMNMLEVRKIVKIMRAAMYA